MLGRAFILPWLFLAVLCTDSALAQDPFAEPGQEPLEPQSVQEAQDSEPPFAEDVDSSGDDVGGASALEDEYGFDPAEEFASDEEPAERDPWEGFNRAIFRFNDTADRWVLRPVATSYRQIIPIFMQNGIANFFANLREVTNTFNSVLPG